MKLLDAVEIKLELLDFSKLQPHPWVSYESAPSCIGVTQILRSLAVQLGKLEARDQADDTMPLRALVGMGWECMASQLYPEMHWQPGVFELDGISGHPDGLSGVDYGLPVVEEFKYTAKSLRVKYGKPDQYKDIGQEWLWIEQTKAYCNLLSHYLSQPVQHVRFHVLWAMGCYENHGLDERYFKYLIEFDQDELDRNWAMLRKHKESL